MANLATKTAIGPMVIVAAEQGLPAAQRVVDDGVAARLLPPMMQAVVQVTRLPALRDWLFNASEQRAPGV